MEREVIDTRSKTLTSLGASEPDDWDSRSSPAPRKSWRSRGRSLSREACAMWMVLKDSRTPWYARLVAVSTVAYLFSPFQLIPSFIPVIGLLDDLAVLWVGFRLVRRLAPADVIRDSWQLAGGMQHLSIKAVKPTVRLATVVIAGIWLMAAIAGAVLLVR